MIILLFYFLMSVAIVHSAHLVVSEPLDVQLPLIARVDKPYSWSFSDRTFGPANANLTYLTSPLPPWLSFDSSTLTFRGTPSAADEGNPAITVTARDSSTSVSSHFTLCVTPYPPPTLRLPLSAQFFNSNPSLSSVFLLAPNSAIATSNPALRVPSKWSFSLGFEGDTFTSGNNLYYEARQRDGSALPQWMVFNSKDITLDGVAPSEKIMPSPTTIPLSLVASDQEGYTASSLPFDLIIAAHELSVSTSSLPTINVTAAMPFNVSLSSPADFSGVLIDGKAIQPSEIMKLSIDTSQYGDWLKYDPGSRSLSGEPGRGALNEKPQLPVIITSMFNQSVKTTLSLALVPSYFSSSELPPVQVAEDGLIQFNLIQYYSNATDEGSRDQVSLTAAFEPSGVDAWLNFDSSAGRLTGIVPGGFSPAHVTVTFTAYSHITHSTSHASLIISITPSSHNKKSFGSHPSGLSAAAHAKLVLGLGIAFGVLGGLCFIGGLLAAFRHCARVEDTALGGEEGRNVWSEQDKKWYGLGLNKIHTEKQERGYGWTERSPEVSEKSRHAIDLPTDYVATQVTNTLDYRQDYRRLGLGLRRVSERSQTDPNGDIGNKLPSPGFMSKREFLTRIKQTVRNVSDKYTHARKVSQKRLVIGKPIMRSTQQPDGLPQDDGAPSAVGSPSDPFRGPGLQSYPGSTIMTNSPSTSTAEHSIPRRRADFAPPRTPALVHFDEGRLSRQLSTGSTGSLASDISAKTHAAEAVVQIASKATSIRSGRSTSGISHSSLISEPLPVSTARPRLVPFTSATRVPVPLPPPSLPSAGLQEDLSPLAGKRIASQTAKVWKNNTAEAEHPEGLVKSGSGDELSIGLHYVQSLGADRHVVGTGLPAPTASTNAQSSFSSLESSHRGQDSVTERDVVRMLVRAGEKFRFRVPIPTTHSTPFAMGRKLEVMLTSGKPLPKFLHVDMSGIKSKGAIEFYGAPGAQDLGEMLVCIYTTEGVLVAQVRVEVAGRS